MSPLVQTIILAVVAVCVLIVVLREMGKTERRSQRLLKDIQQALHQTAIVLQEYRKFKTAFDHAYDAMVITDAEGKIVFINESAARVNGYRRSEVIGTKAGKLWGNLMPKAYYKQLWHKIKVEKQPWYGQFTNHRRDGTHYLAEVTISPIYDEDMNKIVNFVAVERVVGETNAAGVILTAPPVARTGKAKSSRR